MQYLAPIIKNRQYNFPPLGENFFVGASARPNEITYSEDWMRPDYVPAAASARRRPTRAAHRPTAGAAGRGIHRVATDPAAGLPGMMVPPGGGS